MRAARIGSLLVRGLALSASCVAGASALAQEPRLKPGLWRLNKTGITDGRKMVETTCVTERHEQPSLKGDLPGASCSEPIVAGTAAGHVMTMTCQMGDLTLSTTATVSGDYTRRVRYDFVMEASGPAVAASPRKPRRMRSTTVAARLGDCP